MKLLNKEVGKYLGFFQTSKTVSFPALFSLALCQALGVCQACFHHQEISVLLFSVFLKMHIQKTAPGTPVPAPSAPLLTRLLSLAAAWIPHPHALAAERAPSWDAGGVRHGSSLHLLCSLSPQAVTTGMIAEGQTVHCLPRTLLIK